ncbi:MAG: diacylglycerol kinase family lipid kinase [Tissierellia bacterium]|nr:diacylglycerol kinase family lipid kinase [Tissierellia bacterium]
MKIKFVINPSSGLQDNERKTNKILSLLRENHDVDLSYTEGKGDAKDGAILAIKDKYDMIIISGGDGTVNEVANAIGETKSHIPVAILANGTVNDFAKYLEIPTKAEEFVDMIEKGNYIDVDLGSINGHYFANVAGVGTMTEVAHEVDKESKAVFGKMAYYLEGLKKFPEMLKKSMCLKLEADSFEYEGEAILCIISNTTSIGGFKHLAPKARITDGYFDVLLIKKMDFLSTADVFFKSLTGDHVDDDRVLYFHTDHLKVTSTDEDIDVDIDGEYGGKIPLEFKVTPQQFRVIIDSDIEGE